MGTKGTGDRAANLRHAELRLVLLLEDLERAVENADRLAAAGLEEDAIRIIDLQRDALDHLPEQIAADLAPSPRRRFTRRIAAATAAAAMTLVAVTASAIGFLGDDPVTPDAVSRKIASAERMRDLSARLDTIEEALVQIASLEAEASIVEDLARQAETAARRTAPKGTEANDPIADRAAELARIARSHVPAPSEGSSPLEDLLRTD